MESFNGNTMGTANNITIRITTSTGMIGKIGKRIKFDKIV